jgi:hypothetical protein
VTIFRNFMNVSNAPWHSETDFCCTRP